MKRVYLIGYMGAGKTTVGKVLSELTGSSFIDLDYYIEGRFRKTVGQIFAEKGEEVFRDIERRMLHEVAEFEDVIISTGGGTPCFFDNMEFMNNTGMTIYLKVSVEELAKRLELCKHTRPVLKGLSGEQLIDFIDDSLQKRDIYYNRASVVFEAEKMITESDVAEIASALQLMIKERQPAG